MIKVALKGLLGRKLRAILTAFAIVLGVAMISGSFVLTDTLGASLDGVYQESYKGTDAVISSKHKVQQADGTTEKAPFSAGVLTDIGHVSGVRAVQGSIEDHISLVDKAGKRIGKPGDGIAVAVSNPDDTSLSPVKVVAGTWPRHGDEIAIDRATATKQHFAVGQTVGAFGDGPVQRYRISGLITFGSADSLAGSTLTVLDLSTAERLFHKQGKFDLIRVGADKGVSEASLVAKLTPKVPPALVVNTAEAQATSDSKQTQDGLSVFKYILLGFGGIALFVGSFVIANTLAITVAQRMRELATLRTLGASRRQVLGSVVLESVAIGLIGSVIGLFLGLSIALGLMALLGATGVQLPDSSLVFSTRTVIVSLAVGTLIALLASLRPAIRATRIEPIAAVREGATLPKSRFARYAVLTSVGRLRARRRAVLLRDAGPQHRPQGAALLADRGRAAALRRCRDGRGSRRSPAGVRRRVAGCSFRRRRRQARPPERRSQPVPHRLDRRRGDDRPRADHLRRGDRAGRPQLVLELGRPAVPRRLRAQRRRRAAADEQGRPRRGQGTRRHGRLRGPPRGRQDRHEEGHGHGRRPEHVEDDRHRVEGRLRRGACAARSQRRVRRRPVCEGSLAPRRLADCPEDAERRCAHCA